MDISKDAFGATAWRGRPCSTYTHQIKKGETVMMQLHVSGRLVRDPAHKTSSNGRPYIHALMTVSSGDGEALITLMVFDPELGNLLAGLKKGDSLSVIGSGSVRAYADKEGKPAAGITVMV